MSVLRARHLRDIMVVLNHPPAGSPSPASSEATMKLCRQRRRKCSILAFSMLSLMRWAQMDVPACTNGESFFDKVTDLNCMVLVGR
jgi:hypothetical protein